MFISTQVENEAHTSIHEPF